MSNVLDGVTCITVVYKTREIMEEAYNSLREFYPTVKYIVVDNSCGGDCTNYLDQVAKNDKNFRLIKTRVNIGHGLGMQRGINVSKTDYLFIFDSDVIFILGGFLEEGLKLMGKDIYAIGRILEVDAGGRNIRGDHRGKVVKLIYGAYWMLNKKLYPQYPKLTKYGLPLFETFLDIHKKNLSDKVIKEFPFHEYLIHRSGYTRARYGACEEIVL